MEFRQASLEWRMVASFAGCQNHCMSTKQRGSSQLFVHTFGARQSLGTEIDLHDTSNMYRSVHIRQTMSHEDMAQRLNPNPACIQAPICAALPNSVSTIAFECALALEFVSRRGFPSCDQGRRLGVRGNVREPLALPL